jgi:hypothetical protein
MEEEKDDASSDSEASSLSNVTSSSNNDDTHSQELSRNSNASKCGASPKDADETEHLPLSTP